MSDENRPMIERSVIEGFRESFPRIRAYDEAVAALVGHFCGALGVRLEWRATGPRPPQWLVSDHKVFYEEWATVPVLSPIFCLTPKAPPAAGGWMVHLWHDIDYQRLDARVLCVCAGAAESWAAIWQHVQLEGHRGRRIDPGRRAWRMEFEGGSCAWEDEIIELGSLDSEEAFPKCTIRLRALADGLLAEGTATAPSG